MRLALLFAMATLSVEAYSACEILIRGMHNNELTRVTRAGSFNLPTYRRYAVLKNRTGMTSSTEFLAFDVPLSEAQTTANSAKSSSCPLIETPKCQVKLEAPNKVKIEQRVLVNLGGDQYEEQMKDAIVISGSSSSNLNSNVAIFNNGQAALNCSWESGRSNCTIVRNFNASTSTMSYNVAIEGTTARGLSSLNYADAMNTMTTLGPGIMDAGSSGGGSSTPAGPQLCNFMETPAQLDCSIATAGTRFAVVYGTVGRKSFASHEEACSDLTSRVESGECATSGSGDACSDRTGVERPRGSSLRDSIPTSAPRLTPSADGI